jgi:hypothetical protein
MKVRELIENLKGLNKDDEVVIVVKDVEIQSDLGAYEPKVVGRDGWNGVSEIRLGSLISG